MLKFIFLVFGPCLAEYNKRAIINGHNAIFRPFFVHIWIFPNGKAQGPYYSCGGSLISQWFVLTAAHCIHNEKGWQIQYSA